MRAKEIINEDSYQPPSLEVGDKILKGKFKNSPAEIKGFTKDKHNQPVLKTNKGDVQLFKPRIAKLDYAIDEAELDPTGWGAPPQGTDVDYFGIKVKMRPSVFLKLAHPLGSSESNPDVEKHMQGGGKIAYPFLEIKDPVEWEDGDFSQVGRVVNHEGRNRMTHWIKMKGDEPIQVNIFLRGANRQRYVTDGMILAMSQGLISQSGQLVKNPFEAQHLMKEEELTEYEQGTPASDKIIAKLKSLGYEQLGGGLDATVWSKDAGSVIKILMPSRTIPGRVSDAERGFLTFYEFCQQQDSPNLPKFVDIGGAHHTVFEIDGIPYRQIAMERLKPLTPNSFESYMIGMLADLAKMGAPWSNIVNILKRPSTWESTDVIAYRSMPDMVKRKFADPDAYKHWGMLYITIGRLYRAGLKAGLGWDLHGENVMQRNDGTVVITDPYFT